MKKISIWLVIVIIALMMTDIHVLAQTPIEQIAEIGYDVVALEKVRDALKVEQSTLDAEKQQLIEMEKTNKEVIRIFDEKARQLDLDISAWKVEIAEKISMTKQHNKNKPNPYNHEAVNSYNAEANRLDAWRDRLDIKKNNIQRRIDDEKFVANGLENSRKKYNEFVVAWAAKLKSLNNKWDEYWAKVEKIKHLMIDICDKLIKDPGTKDEALKLGCGNVQFDNANPELPPLKE